MSDDDSGLPRRRQASADVVAGREAARLVRELNRELGKWQSASVKVHTIAGRRNLSQQASAELSAEIHRLLAGVSQGSQRLADLLQQAGPAIAGHGRIEDTRRSIEMVRERLLSSLRLLGETPHAGGA
jgi:hypothetical protein